MTRGHNCNNHDLQDFSNTRLAFNALFCSKHLFVAVNNATEKCIGNSNTQQQIVCCSGTTTNVSYKPESNGLVVIHADSTQKQPKTWPVKRQRNSNGTKHNCTSYVHHSQFDSAEEAWRRCVPFQYRNMPELPS